MRGNRRARASLALIATPDTSLLSGTAQWYNIGAGFRYRYGRLRTEVLEQAVKGKFLLDAEVTVPHGGGEFRVPRRRGRLADQPGEPAAPPTPRLRRPGGRTATAANSPGDAPHWRSERRPSRSRRGSRILRDSGAAPERAALPVRRSTARRCSGVAAGRVTVPGRGRPASSRSRARRTSHATGSPPSRRCSLASASVTPQPVRPGGVPARPTAMA